VLLDAPRGVVGNVDCDPRAFTPDRHGHYTASRSNPPRARARKSTRILPASTTWIPAASYLVRFGPIVVRNAAYGFQVRSVKTAQCEAAHRISGIDEAFSLPETPKPLFAPAFDPVSPEGA
jgi:hypothetical protein